MLKKGPSWIKLHLRLTMERIYPKTGGRDQELR
jgi:hypothetical protein